MDAVQDPTNHALVTSIADEACARAKLSFSDSAVASAECEEARVKAGKAAWTEIERAAKEGRQPNLVLDDLMPGLPTGRAATAPDTLAQSNKDETGLAVAKDEASTPANVQGERNVPTKAEPGSCSDIAHVVHKIAEARDKGVPLSNVRVVVPEMASSDQSREALYRLMDMIYENCRYSPDDVEAKVNIQCERGDNIFDLGVESSKTVYAQDDNPSAGHHLDLATCLSLANWARTVADDRIKGLSIDTALTLADNANNLTPSMHGLMGFMIKAIYGEAQTPDQAEAEVTSVCGKSNKELDEEQALPKGEGDTLTIPQTKGP